jgi:phytoene dehydrogenase-like protein
MSVSRRAGTDVVIIGAGHNGLVCAYYLAAAGLKVTILEAREIVGGAAVTEEFAPGFRNSTASYTVSLLQPKVIKDMRLYDHGLQVVLRKVDNFLPTDGPDYLLGGRDGLTRREIARHSPADADRYDAYIAALDGVVAVLRQWLLRAPPNAGGGIGDLFALAQLGRGVGRLPLEEQRHLLDFFTKSAAEILQRYFSHELVQALFGFDSVVGNFASPHTPAPPTSCSTTSSAKRRRARCLGHAIGGMGAITQAMAKACREKGVEIVTGAPVEEIIVERGRAAGVVAGGRAYPHAPSRRACTQAAVRQAAAEGRRARGGERADARLGDGKRHVPHERRAVGAAALQQPARARRPPHRRYHHRALARYMDRAYLQAAQHGWSRSRSWRC